MKEEGSPNGIVSSESSSKQGTESETVASSWVPGSVSNAGDQGVGVWMWSGTKLETGEQ